MVKLKFTAVTNATTTTPILLSYKVKTILATAPKRIFWTKIRVGQGMVNKAGQTESTKYVLQKNCLENSRNATFPVTMVDPDGTTRYVRLLPVQSTDNPWRMVARAESNEVKEWEYNLFLLEVPMS